MKDERGNLYLLTGLIIGIILGIFFAWKVYPTEYFDTLPSSLKAEFKDTYRIQIASAYLANNDIIRARGRLDLLGDEDIQRGLAEQAQRIIAEGGDLEIARALGVLSAALDKEYQIPTIEPTITINNQ